MFDTDDDISPANVRAILKYIKENYLDEDFITEKKSNVLADPDSLKQKKDEVLQKQQEQQLAATQAREQLARDKESSAKAVQEAKHLAKVAQKEDRHRRRHLLRIFKQVAKLARTRSRTIARIAKSNARVLRLIKNQQESEHTRL